MELKWLEDFVALAENGSFSKAAKARYVTQPAFSRRIRALENWLGVNLIDRSAYPTTLSAAGESFLVFARHTISEIYAVRETLRSTADRANSIVIRSQHSLSVSFLPSWLQSLEALVDDKLVKVHADNLHDAVDAFLAGASDFLLCYASNDVIDELAGDHIESVQVGADSLVPVTAPGPGGEPLHRLRDQQPLKLLSYPRKSFLGQLVHRECIPRLEGQIPLRYVYENALAEGLKALALKGYGVAWLPQNLIAQELAGRQLCVLEKPLHCVAMSIRLYRFHQGQTETAAVFWNYVRERYR